MAHERLRRRTGIAVSAVGVVRMVSSGPLSRVAADYSCWTYPSTGFCWPG